MDRNSENVSNTTANPILSRRQRVNANELWKGLRPLNLMIFMLFFGFSISLHVRYRDNLIYRQVCRNRFQTNFKFCYELQENNNNVTRRSIELMDVLNSSSTHVFAMIGLKIVFELFSACLLCSWSDRYGRKFPLFVALMGENFEISAFFISDVPFLHFMVALYVLTALSGLFGGYSCIFSMSYCYLTDHCPSRDRTLAFTLIDFTLMIGIVCGVVAFRKWMRTDTLLVSFSTLLTVRCFLIAWMALTYRQDNRVDPKDDRFFKKFRTLFALSHVKRTYKAVVKWRQNCESEQLMLLICSTIPIMIAYSLVEGVVVSSPLHAKLFSSFQEYQRMSLYFAAYGCAAEPIAVLLYRCLGGVSDSTLGIIGCWNLYLNCFIAAFSSDHLTFLVGLGLAPLRAFAVVSVRSAYSKMTTANDRGKLFFLFSAGETLAILVGYFLYNKLRHLMTVRDDILPHMCMATVLLLALSTFTFQKMSIHTDHLFEKCYRTIHLQQVPTLSRTESE